eukprot:SM000241S08527  [mRNA]  locus=s241:16276:19323:- [translate_table: standard]
MQMAAWQRRLRQLQFRSRLAAAVAPALLPHGRRCTPRLAVTGSLSEVTEAKRTISSPSHGRSLQLATFTKEGGQPRVGIVQDGSVWPLKMSSSASPEVDPAELDMLAVIHDWQSIKDSIQVEGKGTPLQHVELLAPIPKPTGTIFCIGKNYLDHVKEVDTWKSAPGISQPAAPEHPIIFTKGVQSIVGPGAAIKYPQDLSTKVDYEAELAVIIGRSGYSISRADALNHVFGYTVVNDVTARDLQKKHQQWFIGKSCDTFCPMGPWIVPASDLDASDLRIQCWVNDEPRQDGRTSNMIFSIAKIIEAISATMTLHPGDIIATGTPSGVGSGFDPPRHLVPGDTVRISIEGIGVLINHVK